MPKVPVLLFFCYKFTVLKLVNNYKFGLQILNLSFKLSKLK